MHHHGIHVLRTSGRNQRVKVFYVCGSSDSKKITYLSYCLQGKTEASHCGVDTGLFQTTMNSNNHSCMPDRSVLWKLNHQTIRDMENGYMHFPVFKVMGGEGMGG